MASPIFQMRLDPEQRSRWEEAAKESVGAGGSLAEFVRTAVEEKIARADAPVLPPPKPADAKSAVVPGGKKTYA